MKFTREELEKLAEHWYGGGRISEEQIASLLETALRTSDIKPEVTILPPRWDKTLHLAQDLVLDGVRIPAGIYECKAKEA